MPLAVLALVCVATVALGWAAKARCVEGGWNGGEEYTQLCFTDAEILWFNRSLADGAVPYVESELEYPVVLGAYVWVAAAATVALGGGFALFLGLTAVGAAVLAVVVLVLLHRMGAPPGRLWWWAAGPTLLLYAVWNWDLLPIALLLASIALHRSGRDAWSGVAAGLGVAAKVFPALVVPVILVALVRARRPDRLVRFAAAGAGAWLAVNLPVAVLEPSGWWHFYAFSIDREPTRASTWSTLDAVPGLSGVAEVGATLSLPLLLGGVVAILVVGSRRLAPDDLWRLMVPLVAWFLLVSKVYSPQFDLWLLPLLILALPSVRLLGIFVAANVGVVWVEMWNLAERDGWSPALGSGWLALAAAARIAVLVWIVVVSLRARSVAVGGEGDPHGGGTGLPSTRPTSPPSESP